MDKKEELAYVEGSRMAWCSMLLTCLKNLGVDDLDAGKARWLVERVQTISILRRVCESHGDNDWDNDLHLADVVEKHLERYLEE